MDRSDELPEGAVGAFAGRAGNSYSGAAESAALAGARIAVACSMFNGGITARLLDGALRGLAERGVERGSVSVAWVPGAFELPIAARRFAASGEIDAVICLGAVIRGETAHFEYVAGECSAGAQRVALDSGVPIMLGVLTTETLEQAGERSDPDDMKSNKGYEAAVGALEMVDLLRQLPRPAPRAGTHTVVTGAGRGPGEGSRASMGGS